MTRAMLFSPPYGDGIESSEMYKSIFLFSPPCGDRTDWSYKQTLNQRFSPPCGDCTLNISQNTAKLKSRMARKYSLYYNNVLLC